MGLEFFINVHEVFNVASFSADHKCHVLVQVNPKLDVYQRSKLFRHGLQIIRIKERNAFPQKRPPDQIPLPNGPVRRVPIPRPNASLLRGSYLIPESSQLVLVENRVGINSDLAHGGLEVRRRDGGYNARDVGVFGVIEIRQRCIKEVIAVFDWGNHVQWGFTSADDGDSAVGDGLSIFDGSQVAFLAERLQGLDNGLEGFGTGGLYVDEEVERLLGDGIPNTAVKLLLARVCGRR